MYTTSKTILLAGAAAAALTLGTVGPAAAQADVPADQSTTDVAAEPGSASSDKNKIDEGVAEIPGDAIADEILVTGTRILRPNMESNAPVTVVDEAFLRQRGLARIEDALSQIPQVTPMMGLQGNDWTSGRAGVNLRRLGQGRTLTLLNGQRIDNDVGLIPGALIERIDILTGGASAVYGSDAIAGVVNFIIKRRFDGIVFDAEASGFQHRNDNDALLRLVRDAGFTTPPRSVLGGGNFFGSLAAGKDLFDKRVNISGFVTLKEAKPMRQSDIDTTACPLFMNPALASVFRNDTLTCGGGDYSPYGQFSVGDDSYSNAVDGSRTWRPTSPSDRSRVQRDDYLQREDRTISAGGFLTADLFAGIKLDGGFMYNHSRQRTKIVETAPFYGDVAEINCDNPFLGAQQAQLLCGDAAGTDAFSPPTDVILWRKNYLQTMKPQVSNWRGSAKLSGPISGKIRFEASYVQSRDIFRNMQDNAYRYDYEQLGRGLQVRNVNGVPTCLSKIDGTDPDCVPVDAFSSASQPGAAVWDWLTDIGRSRTQNDLKVFNGVISGTLEDYGIRSPFATSGIGFAIVGEQRNVRSQSGGEGAWSSWTKFDGRARVREVAGEIDVPLVQNRPFVQELSVNGGYRLSDYTTYEKLVHTWKVEATYAPVEGLRFRGSYNKALRVPVLERLEGENRYPNEPAVDLCAPPAAGGDVQRYTFDQCSIGMSRAQYDALTSYRGCNIDGRCPAVLINGGNPTLQPERSRSYTAGVVLQPVFLPGFSATVDWYDIQIEAAFEWSRWNLAFDQCYNGKIDFWCSVYKRDPQTGQLREIDARYSNSGYLKSREIDFATTYNFDARRLGLDDFGMINLSFNGTLATKLDRQFAPGTPAWSCLGYHGFACGSPVPTWRHVAGVNWAFPQGQGGLGFTWRYTGGTQISKLSTNSVLAARPTATDPDTFPLIRKLPAVTYIDFNANVALTRFLDVRFNVQNLFDKDPPIIGIDRNFAVGSVNNTYPDYYALRGRTLRVGLTARF